MKNKPISDRRKFFLTAARATGLATLGGLVWSAYVDEVTASQLTLRPPAALKEDDFLKTCIKCGMCVEACPFDTLKLAKPGDNKPLGTPYFEPRDIPCYMCPDIPCVPVCPTDALDITKVITDGNLDINKADMGVAVVEFGVKNDSIHSVNERTTTAEVEDLYKVFKTLIDNWE